jgi:hypothetical protein
MTLKACPERQGSGGIQPAHGWAGSKAARLWSGILKGGTPLQAGSYRGGKPLRRGSKGSARDPSGEECCGATYNLAIQTFFRSGPFRGRRASCRSLYARGQQWTITRKLAVRANLRETESLFSDILFVVGSWPRLVRENGIIPLRSKSL